MPESRHYSNDTKLTFGCYNFYKMSSLACANKITKISCHKSNINLLYEEANFVKKKKPKIHFHSFPKLFFAVFGQIKFFVVKY